MLATLINLTPTEAQQDRTRFGNALETFVFGELLKHNTTSDNDYRLMYYRDTEKFEVDIVIENAEGYLVGVEVKSSAVINTSDLRGLKKFSKLAGDKLKMNVILYDGDETLPLGDRIWAVPLASLWGT